MKNGTTRRRMRAASVFRIGIMAVLVCLLLYGICATAYAVSARQEIVQSAKRMTEAKPKDIVSSRDLTALQSQNSDVIGWLTIDNTAIDFPLMQGIDNFEYLSKDAFGTESEGGSIYLDWQCAPDFSYHYNVIHGHNSHMGVLFDDLCNFEDRDYFDAHTAGSLVTPDAAYRLEIFACVRPDKTDACIYGHLAAMAACENSDNPRNAETATEARAALYAYISENAVQQRETLLTADTKIVALSTCTEQNNDERTVVFAKLVP